jgi:hypothetical protein
METATSIKSKASRLRREYVRVQAIVPGGGGANTGIFIVRRRSDKMLFVEKGVPFDPARDAIIDNGGGAAVAESDADDAGRVREIAIHRTLRHPNIVAYIDSCLEPHARLPAASLYVDYYPLGTLQDFKNRHQIEYLRRPADIVGAREQALLPEAFIWHVLLSLMRALAYLATGYRTELDDGTVRARKNRRPLLHRDVTHHNVLMRRPLRARGKGGDMYPEVALSDFGLAMAADYLAPEHERIRREEKDMRAMDPLNDAETTLDDLKGRIDVRRLGEIVDEMRYYDVAKEGDRFYSQHLRDALALAMDQRNGPTAPDLLRTLVRLQKKVNPPFIALDPTAWEEDFPYTLADEGEAEGGEAEGNDADFGGCWEYRVPGAVSSSRYGQIDSRRHGDFGTR